MRKLKNVIWLCIEKLIILGGGLVTTIIVARYLGAEKYGVFSLAVTLTALPVAVSQWGGNYIIFNNAKNVRRVAVLLVSTLRFRLTTYLAVSSILITFLMLNDYDGTNLIIIGIVMFAGLFQGIDLYQHYFNGTLSARHNALSNFFSRIASISLRLALVNFNFASVIFSLPYFVNDLVNFSLRRRAFKSSVRAYRKNYSSVHRGYFIKNGLPYVFTAVCTFLSLKITEIMLTSLRTLNELAVYNSALMLSHAWTFLPLALGLSLIVNPIEERCPQKKIKGFATVNYAVLFSCVPFLLFIYFFPVLIYKFTFGAEFIKGSDILLIMSFSAMLSTLNVVNNRVISAYCGGKYIANKVVFSAFLSVPVSYFLITHYGLNGAALSVLVIELFNLTFGNYFFSKVSIFKIHAFYVLPKNINKRVVY